MLLDMIQTQVQNQNEFDILPCDGEPLTLFVFTLFKRRSILEMVAADVFAVFIARGKYTVIPPLCFCELIVQTDNTFISITHKNAMEVYLLFQLIATYYIGIINDLAGEIWKWK